VAGPVVVGGALDTIVDDGIIRGRGRRKEREMCELTIRERDE
jgi:hypothetical protein